MKLIAFVSDKAFVAAGYDYIPMVFTDNGIIYLDHKLVNDR